MKIPSIYSQEIQKPLAKKLLVAKVPADRARVMLNFEKDNPSHVFIPID